MRRVDVTILPFGGLTALSSAFLPQAEMAVWIAHPVNYRSQIFRGDINEMRQVRQGKDDREVRRDILDRFSDRNRRFNGCVVSARIPSATPESLRVPGMLHLLSPGTGAVGKGSNEGVRLCPSGTAFFAQRRAIMRSIDGAGKPQCL